MDSFTIGNTPSTPSCSGWQYTGVVAAILGLRQEAGRILRENCVLNNPGTLFPAMWGPIYDAVPDADHGANILNQLQTMLMQMDGNTYLFSPLYLWTGMFHLSYILTAGRAWNADGRTGNWLRSM